MATPTPYRSYIEPNADAEFPAEKGRYHLYVAYTCPFASRALSALYLKGLKDYISISVAHPVFQKTKPDDPNDTHRGYAFVDPAVTPTITAANGKEYSTAGCIPDTVNHTRFVRDLYELVNKEPRPYSVPLLWDKKKKTIVSGESADILRTLNSGFRDLVPSNVDLYPVHLVDQVEAANNGIVMDIMKGFGKVAFGKDAEAYAEGLALIFPEIVKVEELLAKQRYLVGNTITEPDVRLFHILLRFDLAQVATNKQNLTQFPNVVGYLRDLYQDPALKATVNWDHLKLAFINPKPDFVVEGPFVDYSGPHNRQTLA